MRLDADTNAKYWLRDIGTKINRMEPEHRFTIQSMGDTLALGEQEKYEITVIVEYCMSR